MGTMLQAQDPSLDDFAGLEGCNEILNVTRPDIVRAVHRAYLEVGVDAVETNTFGANLANLAEYGIEDRIGELAKAGAELARARSRRLRHAGPAAVRARVGRARHEAAHARPHHVPGAARRLRAQQVAGMLDGGVDAVLVETCQDLLQAKSAVLAAKRAMAATGIQVPILVHVTVETTGTMLLGSEIGAALTALEPLGVDYIGLNCATGPDRDERAPALPVPARADRRVGDAERGPARAGAATARSTRSRPSELAEALSGFVREFGLGLVGGCCGTTPEHLRQVVEAVREVAPARRRPGRSRASPRCTRACRSPRTPRCWSSASGRTPTAPRHSGRPCCPAGGRTASRSPGRRPGTARTCSTCAWTTSAATAPPTCASWPRVSPPHRRLPIMLDSTEPPVIEAGLERLGGRCIINSVNFEDGDGPGSALRPGHADRRRSTAPRSSP